MLAHVSLFTGLAGFDIAAAWAGFETILMCEIDPYCQSILRHHFPNVALIEDVRNVTKQVVADAERNGLSPTTQPGGARASVAPGYFEQQAPDIGQLERGRSRIDLLTAGVPCQPASCAGKRRGQDDDRWLWPEALRVVSEVQPDWVCFENPTGLNSLELPNSEADLEGEAVGIKATLWVRQELERLGYSVGAVVVPACAVGAVHRRDRIFLLGHAVAHTQERTIGAGVCESEPGRFGSRRPGNGNGKDAAYPNDQRCQEQRCSEPVDERARWTKSELYSGRQPEPGFRDLDDGLSPRMAGLPDWYGGDWQMPPPLAKNIKGRVNQLKGLGNAVCPEQVYPVLKAITEYYQTRAF